MSSITSATAWPLPDRDEIQFTEDSMLREERNARAENRRNDEKRRRATTRRRAMKRKAETQAEREAKARELDELLRKSANFSEILTKRTQVLGRVGSSLDGKSLRQANLDMATQPKCVSGGALRDYQLEGLTWLYEISSQGMSGILADEMGLGKTVQIISLIALLREQEAYLGPHLIVAPLSTLSNWMEEFRKWAPSIPVVMYHGNPAQRQEIFEKRMIKNMRGPRPTLDFPVVCTSYEMVLRDQANLMRVKWEFIIIDEGHRMKNADAKLYQHLRRFPSATRLLITGTPLQNNLKELWSLLHFLLPAIFTNWEAFETWFDFSDLEDADAAENFITKEMNKELLQKMHIILQPMLLRRVKQDVAAYLPRKREYVLFAPMTKEQTDLYNAFTNTEVDARAYLRQKVTEQVNNSARASGPSTRQSSRSSSRSSSRAVKSRKVAAPNEEPVSSPLRQSPRGQVARELAGETIDDDAAFQKLLARSQARKRARELAGETIDDDAAFQKLLARSEARKRARELAGETIDYDAHFQKLVAWAEARKRARELAGGDQAAFRKLVAQMNISKPTLSRPPIDGPQEEKLESAPPDAANKGAKRKGSPEVPASDAKKGAKRKSSPAGPAPPNSKRARSTRASSPVMTRGKRTKYAEASSDEEALSDDAFEAKLADEAANADSEEEEADDLLPPEEAERQETLDMALKQLSRKKLGNPLAQLRLVCNSPHNFYNPWATVTDVPVDESIVTSSGKMLLLDRLLHKLFASGHKVLLFSQFKTQLDILEDYSRELRGWNVCRIDGSVPQDSRRQQIHDFNNDPAFKLFLLSTRAGGQGINLASADTVIIFDSDFNPQQDLQAQDRCHRIGQTRPVIVYRLATRDTVEETLLMAADAKRRLEKLVIKKGSVLDDVGPKGGPGKAQLDDDTLRNLLLRDGQVYEASSTGGSEILSDRDLEVLCDRSEAAYENAAKGLGDADLYRVVETGADSIQMAQR